MQPLLTRNSCVSFSSYDDSLISICQANFKCNNFLRGASYANLISQLWLKWGYIYIYFFSESYDFTPIKVW